MRALLDVNVLIALLDRQHQHHAAARRWLEDNVQTGWATCAITQNGTLRIMSQPKYESPWQVSLVAEKLVEMTSRESHEFWPDTVSLLTPGVIDWRQTGGHKQITDLYLLALAAKNNGRFVTFDRHIKMSAVPNASDENYCLIQRSYGEATSP